MTAASRVAGQVNLAAQIERVPLTCFWEITSACNLRCIHCEADAGTPSADELSTEEALALAAELASAGCRNVNLTGGEPLVRRDWPLLARRLAELGLSVTVISNGVLLDEHVIERMVEAGVNGASISLDGDREVHDTIRVPPGRPRASRYDAALRAIELLALRAHDAGLQATGRAGLRSIVGRLAPIRERWDRWTRAGQAAVPRLGARRRGRRRRARALVRRLVRRRMTTPPSCWLALRSCWLLPSRSFPSSSGVSTSEARRQGPLSREAAGATKDRGSDQASRR